MGEVATTAQEAFERYELAFKEDRLTQGAWHTEQDGRQLACALGTLGDTINDPKDCPASIMPRWLAQMVPAFFDCQRFDDAKEWGVRFYAALAKLDGNVPFSVVHHWHAHTVCRLGIDAAEKRGRSTAPHIALQALHLRALAGEKISADEWRPILKDTYAYANANANANANAYAYADADANAYANAYAYADADANAYANAYADADAYAYANANAYAYANANAYADANANANANAYAYAYANAYANANANANANAWKRLADGMVDALTAAA